MSDLTIQVEQRDQKGKNANRRLRASGVLPTGPGDLLSFLSGMNVEFVNFDQLFELRGLSLDDLLNGIIAFIDVLNDENGLLHKNIPGINQSVSGLVSEQLGLSTTGFLDFIKTEIEGVRDGQSLNAAEDALNGIFNSLFGAGTDPVSLRLDESVLVLDLSFETLLARFEQALNLDLASFADQLGLGGLIGQDIVDTVADKLSIGSTGINLFADIIVGFNIGVGVDLWRRHVDRRCIRVHVVHVLRWRLWRRLRRFGRLLGREILYVQGFVAPYSHKLEVGSISGLGQCRFTRRDQQVHHEQQAQRNDSSYYNGKRVTAYHVSILLN